MIVSRLARLTAATLVALAGLTAAATAAPPQAQTATTTTSVNMRQGPGTTYSTVDTLAPGTDVIVHACTQTWCAVTTDNGENGFIYKPLLDFSDDEGDGGPPPPPPPHQHPQPQGGGVCFFQGPNFTGPSFCADGGEGDSVPYSFRGRIRSILIDDGVEVDVCAGGHLNGECRTLDHSLKFLPPDANIGSYQVGGDDGGHWSGPGDQGDDDGFPPDDDGGDDDGSGFYLQ